MTKIDTIARKLHTMKARAERKILDFKKNLDVNPAHAMMWADSVFGAAAEFEFATDFLAHLEATAGRDDQLELFKNRLDSLLRARAVYVNNRSTSVSSNKMEDERCAVVAKFLQDNFPIDY